MVLILERKRIIVKRMTITGNLAHDPIMRKDKLGQEFVTFSVGINVGSRQHPRTDWVEISCNGKLAGIVIAHAKKGNKVLVDGFPQVYAYTNTDNTSVAIQRIYAHEVELLNRVGDDVNEINSVAQADYGIDAN